MSMMEDTHALLAAARKKGWSFGDIARASGETVEREWLKRFSRRVHPDPSVNRVESLLIVLRQIRNKVPPEKTAAA